MDKLLNYGEIASIFSASPCGSISEFERSIGHTGLGYLLSNRKPSESASALLSSKVLAVYDLCPEEVSKPAEQVTKTQSGFQLNVCLNVGVRDFTMSIQEYKDLVKALKEVGDL